MWPHVAQTTSQCGLSDRLHLQCVFSVLPAVLKAVHWWSDDSKTLKPGGNRVKDCNKSLKHHGQLYVVLVLPNLFFFYFFFVINRTPFSLLAQCCRPRHIKQKQQGLSTLQWTRGLKAWGWAVNVEGVSGEVCASFGQLRPCFDSYCPITVGEGLSGRFLFCFVFFISCGEADKHDSSRWQPPGVRRSLIQ